jgi:hypothetical protein
MLRLSERRALAGEYFFSAFPLRKVLEHWIDAPEFERRELCGRFIADSEVRRSLAIKAKVGEHDLDFHSICRQNSAPNTSRRLGSRPCSASRLR